MDGARFDGMVRLWTMRGARRTALRLLARGSLSFMLAPALATSAAAVCKPPRGRCRKKTDCCTGRCNRKHRRCRGCGKGAHYCPATQACLPVDQCCADPDCRSSCYQGACCTLQQFEAGLCAPLGRCFDPQGIPGCCQTDADCRDGCDQQGTCCTDARFQAGFCGPLGACACD
ncbi:MAG TPA: hypothetical protein VFU81_23180 [Thermomicrobiales bacterium]|nr:hypothetical protein [Thermomicrobiales bacterium]